MRRILIPVCCVCITIVGCSWFSKEELWRPMQATKSPNTISTEDKPIDLSDNPLLVQTQDTISSAKENYSEIHVLLPPIEKRMYAQMAKFGFFVENSISVHVQKWESTSPDNTIVFDSQGNISILLIAEKVVEHDILEYNFSKLCIQACLQKYKNFKGLPIWLQDGIVAYISGMGETEVHRAIANLLEDNIGLEAISFWENSQYPSAAGYMALKFAQKNLGSKAIIDFLHAILENGLDWEEQTQKLFAMSSLEWQEKSKNFLLSELYPTYHPIIVVYRNALRSYLQEDYFAAIPIFRKITLEFPKSPVTGGAWFWMGMAYFRSQKYEQARKYFYEASLDYASKYFVESEYRLGLCFLQQKLYDEAMRALQKFTKRFPYHDMYPSSLFFLAESQEKSNLTKDAILTYQKFMATSTPRHARYRAAQLSVAKLALELSWLPMASEYIQTLNMQQDLTTTENTFLQQLSYQLKIMQESGLPQAIAADLQKKMQFLSESDTKIYSLAQDEILADCFRLGKHGFLILENWLPNFSQAVITKVVLETTKHDNPYMMPLLCSLLRFSPENSYKILYQCTQLKTPAESTNNMVQDAISQLSPEPKKQASSIWDSLLWKTTPLIWKHIPNILQLLNGKEEQQCEAIGLLARKFEEEQIPILQIITQKGHPLAQKIAHENIQIWIQD